MNPTKLALTLAITGVASAVLNAMNKPRQKADDTTEFDISICNVSGVAQSTYCGATPVEDDVVFSDVQDDVPPTPVGDPPPPPQTDFRSLPIYG